MLVIFFLTGGLLIFKSSLKFFLEVIGVLMFILMFILTLLVFILMNYNNGEVILTVSTGLNYFLMFTG